MTLQLHATRAPALSSLLLYNFRGVSSFGAESTYICAVRVYQNTDYRPFDIDLMISFVCAHCARGESGAESMAER